MMLKINLKGGCAMYTDDLKETTLSSEKVYNGRLLHVYNDKISLPNGHTSTREIVRHVGAVCIVPITENNEVIIEKQFRYPFNEVLTEIPAGKLDSKDEDPLDAAKRELKEETGYTADTWTYLGIYYPTVAYTDEKIYIYMARNLHRGTQHLDDDEFLHYYSVPLETLIEDIKNDKIPDGKTQLGILKAARIFGY